MPEDLAIEQLYQDWKAARVKLDEAREQYGLVAKAVTDAPIELPNKALTPPGDCGIGQT